MPPEAPEHIKGTYVLVLHLPVTTRLKIGRLGDCDFAAGWYTYAGSAFGPGGLRGRLKHHLAPVRKPHWHIDYLRQAAPCEAIWVNASLMVYEHTWAASLSALPGAQVPVPRFGASDCRCPTHLLYFAHPPTLDDFNRHLPEPATYWHGELQIPVQEQNFDYNGS